MSEPAETINKIDAAERQIRTAVRLFFAEDDIVSIITLARAGAGVLRDLGVAEGIADNLLDSDRVKPEYRTRWINAVQRPQNFFKHADRDPNSELELRIDVVPLLVFNAVDLLWRVAARDVPESRAFTGWFLANEPMMIADEYRQETVQRFHLSGLDRLSKRQVLNVILQMRDLETAGEWPPLDSQPSQDNELSQPRAVRPINQRGG